MRQNETIFAPPASPTGHLHPAFVRRYRRVRERSESESCCSASTPKRRDFRQPDCLLRSEKARNYRGRDRVLQGFERQRRATASSRVLDKGSLFNRSRGLHACEAQGNAGRPEDRRHGRSPRRALALPEGKLGYPHTGACRRSTRNGVADELQRVIQRTMRRLRPSRQERRGVIARGSPSETGGGDLSPKDLTGCRTRVRARRSRHAMSRKVMMRGTTSDTGEAAAASRHRAGACRRTMTHGAVARQRFAANEARRSQHDRGTRGGEAGRNLLARQADPKDMARLMEESGRQRLADGDGRCPRA